MVNQQFTLNDMNLFLRGYETLPGDCLTIRNCKSTFTVHWRVAVNRYETVRKKMAIHWLTMIKWTVHEKIQSICRWRFNNLQQFILLYVKIWRYNNTCRCGFKKVQIYVCYDGGSTEHDILLRVSMWWLTDMQSYMYPKIWQ